ncbi:MAG: DUF296 domain-containing protein [Spirochaetia bacterium]|nr:DUF296 domain-containing protein [Spirochaetia bacterium]
MKYKEGKIGRTFVIKFEDGDDFNAELTALAKKEKVKTGFFVFLGSLRKASIVCGPKKPVIPPDPNWIKIDGAWEIFGTGSVFTSKAGPMVHIHTSMGKGKKTLTGCVRKDSSVFIVIEAMLVEIKGVKAEKAIDPVTGINMLKLG